MKCVKNVIFESDYSHHHNLLLNGVSGHEIILQSFITIYLLFFF